MSNGLGSSRSPAAADKSLADREILHAGTEGTRRSIAIVSSFAGSMGEGHAAELAEILGEQASNRRLVVAGRQKSAPTMAPSPSYAAEYIKDVNCSKKFDISDNLIGITKQIFRRSNDIYKLVNRTSVEVVIATNGDPLDLSATAVAAARLRLPFVAVLFSDPLKDWGGQHRLLSRLLETIWLRQAAALIGPGSHLPPDFLARHPRAIKGNSVNISPQPTKERSGSRSGLSDTISAEASRLKAHHAFWQAVEASVPPVDARAGASDARRRRVQTPSRSTARGAVAPRVLFVAMQDSPHTARWIELIGDRGWDLHLFPLNDEPVNPHLSSVKIHRPRLSPGGARTQLPLPASAGLHHRPAEICEFRTTLDAVGTVEALHGGNVGWGTADTVAPPLYGPGVLADLISELKPDLVHSMEFQHSGYLALGARRLLNNAMPTWLATNWGSDIYYFKRFQDHAAVIREILSRIDFYSCECSRDIQQAREMGYRGPVLKVLPNTGGFDLEHISALRSFIPPSRRKIIMVKGYQHFAGRAITALEALSSISDLLTDYEVLLYSAMAEPLRRAAEMREQGILNIRPLGRATHDQMLSAFGSARIYLGISISDGISTSALEAMAMGTFPIQTNTSCCDEWFEHGRGGFIVPPDDLDAIRDCLRAALTNDSLVDEAATINAAVVAERLDRRVLAPRMMDFYEPVLGPRVHHRFPSARR